MFKCIICHSFKKFHRAVFSLANPKYSNFGGIIDADSEASNRYTHLFLIERGYFGFNTLYCVIVEYCEISSIYEYPVWRKNTCKTVALGKRGDAPRYHPGIKNLI